MALDVGDKRIGFATAESEESLVATPRCVVTRRNRARDSSEVVRKLVEWTPETVVVGVPLSADNMMTDQGRKIVKFIKRIDSSIPADIVLVDEAFSTREAVERFSSRHSDDAAAAAVVLGRYLSGSALILEGLLG